MIFMRELVCLIYARRLKQRLHTTSTFFLFRLFHFMNCTDVFMLRHYFYSYTPGVYRPYPALQIQSDSREVPAGETESVQDIHALLVVAPMVVE
jgi:hypothetical protein